MNDNKTTSNFNEQLDKFLEQHPRCRKGDVCRWLLSATHYRKPINITTELYLQALQNLDKLYTALDSFPEIEWRPSSILKDIANPEDTTILRENALKGPLDQSVIAALCDDLNTPLAYSRLHKLAKEINKESDATKKYNLQLTLLRTCQFLGFLLETPKEWFNPYFHRYTKKELEELKQQQLNMINELSEKLPKK